MIRRLRLENYRSHGSTELGLEPLSLLVGPAGAGKSNLLKALVFLQNSVQRPLTELLPPASPWDFRNVRSRWADETAPMGFVVELSIGEYVARYVLRFAEAPAGVYVLEETLARRVGDRDWQWVFQRRWNEKPEIGEFGTFTANDPTVLNRIWHGTKPGDAREGIRFARDVAKSLWKTGYYHLETSWLREPGDDRDQDRIGYRGEGLPGFLARLQREEPQSHAEILQAMRELLPTLDQIIVNRIGPDRQGMAMTFRDQRGYVNAPDLSDGTMLTLGLLAITKSKQLPRLLCIEELETGLHPARLRWLFDRFLEIAHPTMRGADPVQIVLTSHSPYLVNLFQDMPHAVTVVEHKDGRTSMRNLVEIKAALHDTSVGSPIGHEWATGLFEGL